MKAMVLAAGLGTRLRPLTDYTPKALVEVGGRTLLQITLARLRDFGVGEVIINLHHLGEQVVEYLKKNGNFGMRVELSQEEILLDTGGSLKKAAWFFEPDPDDEPFILHNVDVISTIDLHKMFESHRAAKALATLAVQKRETSRYLLFDDQFQLCGRQTKTRPSELVRPAPKIEALAFCGIHVISPRLLRMLTEQGAFSIIASYLRLAGAGEKIAAFRADDSYWRDLGRPENLVKAEQELKARLEAEI